MSQVFGGSVQYCPIRDCDVPQDALRRRALLASLIHVVDKYDEDNWTIDWPKRHDIISKLGTTRSGEC